MSVLSYAGKFQFGLITDPALTPDPEAIVSRFAEEFQKYLYYVLLELPEPPSPPIPGEKAVVSG
jgi:diacylglycerol O-acyltransferase / wax synthase